ncbi:MAG: sulfurtransferase [Alphaproteobacteria bacterium]|nr:sulfurtransferase [Alphaproteobacteria bacterium]
MEIDVLQLKALRDAGEPHVLLDVREPRELAVCRIADTLHIPMQQVPQRLAEVPQDIPVVVMCHHGSRSGMVTRFLREQGYGKAVNLRGGIDAWAQAVDPSIARY